MCKQLELNLINTFWPDDESHPWKQGYDSGINWDANWMPGGPWYYNEITKIAHKEWMEGFNVGLAERLEANAHFKAWWEENMNIKQDGRYKRYYPPTEETT